MSDSSYGDRSIVEAIKEKIPRSGRWDLSQWGFWTKSDDPVWEGIHVVQGNMDFMEGYPERLVTQLGPTRIIQTHGHLFQINLVFKNGFGPKRKKRISVYTATFISQMLEGRKNPLVNPGSVSQPRGLIRECLYAKIEITDSNFKVEYYTRDHELYLNWQRSLADDSKGIWTFLAVAGRDVLNSCQKKI